MKYSFNIFVFSQTQVSSMVFDFFFLEYWKKNKGEEEWHSLN